MSKRPWPSTENNAPEDTRPPPPPTRRAPSRPTPHSGLGASSNDFDADDPPLPLVSRKIKACSKCRKHKIKCIIDDDGPPCRRCAEKKLNCVMSKSLQTILDEKSQFSESVVQDLEQMHEILKQLASKAGLPPIPPLKTPSQESSTSAQKTQSVPSPYDQPGPSCDSSPKSMPEDAGLPHVPIRSLYTLTKLRALRSPDDDDPQNGQFDDFISRGSISVADAEKLFNFYRTRLEPYIYQTGCPYKSLDEVRAKSPALTAATLTVAALHDSKSDTLYGVCSSEFRRLVQLSLFDRRIDRDYLRAMCVASYWLSDLSWTISGYAIRRAVEFDLHNSYHRAVEEHSHEDADCTRLWYILYICDQQHATLYGRPSLVQEDTSVQGWEVFLNSEIANEEDNRLLSQVAVVSILRAIRELFNVDKRKPIPRVYLNHIFHFKQQLDQWFQHWTGKVKEQWPEIGSFPRKGIMLHHNFAQLYLYSHIFRGLSQDQPFPSYFLDCASNAIQAATTIVDLMINDPDIAIGIVGMPSYVHSMTAFASMFLTKVTIIYGGHLIERERVYTLIVSLVQQYRLQPAGKWHLPKLMITGLERMAETLKPVTPGGMSMGPNMPRDQGRDMNGNILGLDNMFTDLDCDVLFNYDMNFGLSGPSQL
ncbi:hypothetical protein EDB81DRAFT_854096 [Dactylonectria macrodidyma]|uniref:Zn(2)-C6 fungal-type domain-containing protein n=1 Tax=Dactylonectria macrodidyma TaxID=307937 RepID=A0A9P9JHM2_9HYPO|nr:hypothetical protein EDB81DRAFT_854096 [Dactylonectria macrodidyma]